MGVAIGVTVIGDVNILDVAVNVVGVVSVVVAVCGDVVAYIVVGS